MHFICFGDIVFADYFDVDSGVHFVMFREVLFIEMNAIKESELKAFGLEDSETRRQFIGFNELHEASVEPFGIKAEFIKVHIFVFNDDSLCSKSDRLDIDVFVVCGVHCIYRFFIRF